MSGSVRSSLILENCGGPLAWAVTDVYMNRNEFGLARSAPFNLVSHISECLP